MRQDPAPSKDQPRADNPDAESPLLTAHFPVPDSALFRPAISRRDNSSSLHPWWHFENEERFFIKAETISSRLQGATLSREYIFQAYFSRSKTRALLYLAKELAPAVQFPDENFISRCRIRRVCPVGGGATQYFLQFKGPKSSNCSRLEIPVPLSQRQFHLLLPEATKGSLDKLRYVDHGWVLDRRGQRQSAVAHIDFLLQAGRSSSVRAPHDKVFFESFAFIDIETREPSLLRALKYHDRHSFSYLKHGINMRFQPLKWRRVLASYQLAKYGLNAPEVLEALQELHQAAGPRAISNRDNHSGTDAEP